jgi:hypothetical protein
MGARDALVYILLDLLLKLILYNGVLEVYSDLLFAEKALLLLNSNGQELVTCALLENWWELHNRALILVRPKPHQPRHRSFAQFSHRRANTLSSKSSSFDQIRITECALQQLRPRINWISTKNPRRLSRLPRLACPLHLMNSLFRDPVFSSCWCE